jgi:hypothetical protein
MQPYKLAWQWTYCSYVFKPRAYLLVGCKHLCSESCRSFVNLPHSSLGAWVLPLGWWSLCVLLFWILPGIDWRLLAPYHATRVGTVQHSVFDFHDYRPAYIPSYPDKSLYCSSHGHSFWLDETMFSNIFVWRRLYSSTYNKFILAALALLVSWNLRRSSQPSSALQLS